MAALSTGASKRMVTGAMLPPSHEITYTPAWRGIAEMATPYVFPWRVDEREEELRVRQAQTKDQAVVMALHSKRYVSSLQNADDIRDPFTAASIALLLKVLMCHPNKSSPKSEEAYELAIKLLSACSWKEVESYILFFYHCLQCDFISMYQMVRLLDMLSKARGAEAREEVHHGIILQSISGRSAPGPKREMEVGRMRERHPNALSVEERKRLSQIPYCQLETCHAMEGYDFGTTLSVCDVCGGVSYCCDEHREMDQERHAAWCSRLANERMLRSALSLDELAHLARGIHFVRCYDAGKPHQYLPRHQPLDLLSLCKGHRTPHEMNQRAAYLLRQNGDGWQTYFSLRRKAMAKAGLTYEKDSEFIQKLRTDSLSSVLTVAHSLYKLGPDITQDETGKIRRDIDIWLLGAAQEEDQPWEELFAWHPNLKTIRITMIGPCLSPESNSFCRKNPGKQQRVLMVRKKICCLHEISDESIVGELAPPMVIFALNSGAIFAPQSWEPTFAMILNKVGSSHPKCGNYLGAPLIVSASMQPEALGVREMIIRNGGRPVPGFELSSNVWSSLIPKNQCDDHGSVAFHNRFIMAFQTCGMNTS